MSKFLNSRTTSQHRTSFKGTNLFKKKHFKSAITEHYWSDWTFSLTFSLHLVVNVTRWASKLPLSFLKYDSFTTANSPLKFIFSNFPSLRLNFLLCPHLKSFSFFISVFYPNFPMSLYPLSWMQCTQSCLRSVREFTIFSNKK